MENQNEIKDEKTQLSEAEHYRASAEAHKQELKSSWKIFWRTGAFMLAALSVLIIICLAWFRMNTQVKGSNAAVSAQQDIIRIASKGVRQTAEKSTLNLAEGTRYEYGGDTYYYTEGGEIAMYLSEDYSVYPGASGSIEFYIIPMSDGARTVSLYLGLSGYADVTSEEGSFRQAERVNDDTLDALMSGHILLFNNYEDGFYSEWLYNENTNGILNNTITIQLTEEAKKGVPYPYTLYWIWPKRYENMMNDLFAADSEEFANNFSTFVVSQSKDEAKNQIGTTSYSYSRIFLANSWPLETFDARTKAYNLADEYIGTNADYLYLTIRTAPSE